MTMASAASGQRVPATASGSVVPVISVVPSTPKALQVRRPGAVAARNAGEITTLVVSKVANFSIDLPDANVAVQVSGSFGSRQEEAQRLGRVLRPKKNGEGAHFYTVVTKDSKESDFAMKRQLFLTEQGYRYLIQDATPA
jgi:DNA excision repair protein ERCC-3